MAKTHTRLTAAAVVPGRARYDELKQMLEGRRDEMRVVLQGQIRDVRADGSEKPYNVLDEVESSEVDSQEAIALALIQMRAETLEKITDALSRLENGVYGHCLECGDDIAEPRLRALPFAARCKDCEEVREAVQLRERMRQRHGLASLSSSLRGQTS